jgi:hypothetical protein
MCLVSAEVIAGRCAGWGVERKRIAKTKDIHNLGQNKRGYNGEKRK